MRTIDVDKLCVDLMERWDIADKQKEELVRHMMADIVTPIVVSQPTVEPERKKGKWIEQDDCWDGVYYECSVCKEPFTLIDGTPSDNLYNFCPNCGADMTSS